MKYYILFFCVLLNMIAFFMPGKLKWPNLLMVIGLQQIALSLGLVIFFFVWDLKHPSPDKLKITNGIIHHPTYGDYPQKVKYTPGMSLMPGQEAELEIKWPKDQSE